MANTTKIEVDAANLPVVLAALHGPAHHIRELQATMSSHALSPNPIVTLTEEFNAAVKAQSHG